MTHTSQPPADHRRLAQDIEDLRAELAKLTAELGDLSAAIAPSVGATHDGTEYGDLREWVNHYFLTTFHRLPAADIRWCNAWAQHPEAIVRLTALWHSWEALQREPDLGMVTWLTNHLDPQLAVLQGRTGPFAQCTPTRHTNQIPSAPQRSPAPTAGSTSETR